MPTGIDGAYDANSFRTFLMKTNDVADERRANEALSRELHEKMVYLQKEAEKTKDISRYVLRIESLKDKLRRARAQLILAEKAERDLSSKLQEAYASSTKHNTRVLSSVEDMYSRLKTVGGLSKETTSSLRDDVLSNGELTLKSPHFDQNRIRPRYQDPAEGNGAPSESRAESPSRT